MAACAWRGPPRSGGRVRAPRRFLSEGHSLTRLLRSLPSPKWDRVGAALSRVDQDDLGVADGADGDFLLAGDGDAVAGLGGDAVDLDRPAGRDQIRVPARV